MKSEQQIDDFKKEIIEVCKKHKLSISHEDGHGAFLIEDYNKIYEDWFMSARFEKENNNGRD